MKRLLLFTFFAALFFSCERATGTSNLISISRGDGTSRPDKEDNLPQEELPDLPEGKSLYVCGVDYSKDGTTELVLFKDGVRLQAYECSNNTLISDEADSHFLINGDLYTSFTYNGKTSLSKNGELLFQINGKEYIRSILILDDILLSASVFTTSNGFPIRKNGNTVFSKQDGALKTFYIDENNICFEYLTEWEGKKQIFLVKNTIESALKAHLGTDLLCARFHQGKIWYLEYASPYYIIHSGSQVYKIPQTYGFEYTDSELQPLENGTCAAVIHLKSNYSPMTVDYICKTDTSWIEGAGTLCHYYMSQYPERKVCLNKDRTSLVITGSDKHSISIENAYIATERCGTQENGKLFLGLTLKDENQHPIIWSEGNSTPYNIKGTITGICFTPPK